jgi:hypothetical protein
LVTRPPLGGGGRCRRACERTPPPEPRPLRRRRAPNNRHLLGTPAPFFAIHGIVDIFSAHRHPFSPYTARSVSSRHTAPSFAIHGTIGIFSAHRHLLSPYMARPCTAQIAPQDVRIQNFYNQQVCNYLFGTIHRRCPIAATNGDTDGRPMGGQPSAQPRR